MAEEKVANAAEEKEVVAEEKCKCHCHEHICFCFFAKAQDWLKDKFYDKENKRYKHKWVFYVGIALYALHWLWHIAVGAVVIDFVYNLFK